MPPPDAPPPQPPPGDGLRQSAFGAGVAEAAGLLQAAQNGTLPKALMPLSAGAAAAAGDA